MGVAEGRPQGGAFDRCEGRLRSGPPPPPTAHRLGGPLGSATHVLWARVCGCGGPTLSPWPACPVGAACRGGGGGPSPGGVACHCCEGRLVSGAVPPPAARPLGRAARVPRPVCPRCGRCGHGDPAPAPRRAPSRGGVARRGGGGRKSPGGVPSAVVRGDWGQALPLPRLLALWAGSGGSLATCCGRPDLSSVRACGRGPLPTGCGCGGCACGDPSPTPQRALLRAGFAHCGGGMRVPEGGASCLGEGRPGTGALPPPTSRPLRAGGAHYPLAVGAGGAGVGARHQPHTARSCELAFRAVGAA